MSSKGPTDQAGASIPAVADDRSGTQHAASSARALAARARSLGLTLLFVLLALLLLFTGKRLIASNADSVALDAAAPPLAVRSSSIKLESSYVVPESYVGQVEPRRQTDLGFEAGGTLEAMLVDEGDPVQKGELIARLDKRALLARRREQRALHDALAAQLELAELTRERQRDLLRRTVSSAQEFDEARLRAEELAAGLQRLDAVVAGLDIELDKSDIRAPFSGSIGARFVDEGASVAPGAAVVSLLEDAAPRVRIGVSPRAARVLAATKTHVIESQGRHFQATLDRLRPDMDRATRTLTAVFRITTDSGAVPQAGSSASDATSAEHEPSVPFGEMARIVIARKIADSGAWVPTSALSEGERGLWSLYVLDDSQDPPLVQRESVEVLYGGEQRAYVRGSFVDGVRYIDSGAHRVTAGQRIRDTEHAREARPTPGEPL